jgi:hypothetical protein
LSRRGINVRQWSRRYECNDIAVVTSLRVDIAAFVEPRRHIAAIAQGKEDLGQRQPETAHDVTDRRTGTKLDPLHGSARPAKTRERVEETHFDGNPDIGRIVADRAI